MYSYSIILPVRNGGNYVKQCVNSLLAQDYTNFNVLILDNDSTDGTLEWLSQIDDKRIKVFPHSLPLNICGNWGRIAGLEKNEYMTMIGSDDILLPNYLSEMNRLIAGNPKASLYQAHFEFIDAEGKVMHSCQKMRFTYSVGEYVEAQLTRTLDSMGTGYMMRSADYNRIGGIPTDYPNLIFADYALWVQLTSLSYMAVSKVKTFQYRLHNSVSRVTNGEDYTKAFFMYLEFLYKLKSLYPDIQTAIERNFKSYLLYFCQSLSHRLLNTSAKNRKTSVADFVDNCVCYANKLIPGQGFFPLRKLGIQLAVWLDRNNITRLSFKIIKQMTLLFRS